jgi:phospholipid/cholesterol/gamma-HCH transport system substrate-binding protein
MDENRLRFGVGVLVVASLGIAVILTFFFGAYPNLFAGTYKLRVRFPAAPGVSNETPVLKNGVRIGRVTDIELLNRLRDNGAEGVEIELEIDDQFPLFGAEIPRITSGSLITGAAQIEFVSAGDADLLELYDGQAGEPPDGELDPAERALAERPLEMQETLISYGEVSRDPYEVFNMIGNLESDVRDTLAAIQQAGQSVEAAGRQVDDLAVQVRSFVAVDDDPQNEGELRRLTRRADQVLQDFDTAIANINRVFGNEKFQSDLFSSVERLPRVLENAEGTFQTFRATLEEFEGIGESAKRTVQAAERTATNVAEFTEPLGENGEELVAAIQQTIADLDRAVIEVGTFTERLNRGGGTLGMLLEDDALYWQVKRIADNIERATVQIRPILSDVRVFSDKIARDPRQLGVKGALSRRATGLGLK